MVENHFMPGDHVVFSPPDAIGGNRGHIVSVTMCIRPGIAIYEITSDGLESSLAPKLVASDQCELQLLHRRYECKAAYDNAACLPLRLGCEVQVRLSQMNDPLPDGRRFVWRLSALLANRTWGTSTGEGLRRPDIRATVSLVDTFLPFLVRLEEIEVCPSFSVASRHRREVFPALVGLKESQYPPN